MKINYARKMEYDEGNLYVDFKVIYAPSASSILFVFFLHKITIILCSHFVFSVIMCNIMIIWHRKTEMSFGSRSSTVKIYARLYCHFSFAFRCLFYTLRHSLVPSLFEKVHLILFILFFTQYYHKVFSSWLKPLFNDIGWEM